MTTSIHDTYGADEADGAQCRALATALRAVAPRTGAPCSCKRGVQRDNCPQCEGSGWVIDFRALRGGQS